MNQTMLEAGRPEAAAVPRRRRVGRGAVILGVALSLVSVTGVLAAFTDVATNGPITADGGVRGRPIDLRINAFATAQAPCGNLGEDVTTPVLSLSGAALGDTGTTPISGWQRFCVANVGAAPAAVTMRAVEVISRELGCTGAEFQVDVDCSGGVYGNGDLYPIVSIAFAVRDVAGCMQNPPGADVILTFDELDGPNSFEFPIPAKEQRCLLFRIDRTADETQLQRAQTDRLQWRFRLTATEASSPVTLPPNPDS